MTGHEDGCRCQVCANYEPPAVSELGDHLDRRAGVLATGALAALGLALILLLVWLFTVGLSIQRVADATATTTRHTDAEVVRIVQGDQAHIKALTGEISTLTTAVNLHTSHESALQAQLVTVESELSAVDAQLLKLGVRPVNAYPAPKSSTTTTTTTSTTTTTTSTTTTTTFLPHLPPTAKARC